MGELTVVRPGSSVRERPKGLKQSDQRKGHLSSMRALMYVTSKCS